MNLDATPDQGEDGLDRTVAHGGPMDGKILGLADAESYEVGLADRTRRRHVETPDREVPPDCHPGSRPRVRGNTLTVGTVPFGQGTSLRANRSPQTRVALGRVS